MQLDSLSFHELCWCNSGLAARRARAATKDYVHNEGHKMVSVALNSFFLAAVAIAGVYAVLKIGIQS
jgi:hypothetical protein